MTEYEKKLETALMNLGADIRKAEEVLNKGRVQDRTAVYNRIAPWLDSMKGDLDQISKIFNLEVKG